VHEQRSVGALARGDRDPEERLSVRSQITLLDEAAIALQDDSLGFTLARDFDSRALGLLYYVMASSQTLRDALKRVARYSQMQSRFPACPPHENNVPTSRQNPPRDARWHRESHSVEASRRAHRWHNVVAAPVDSPAVPRSPVSLSPGDEVPHIFTRAPRLRLEKLAIICTRRLLQQNLPEAVMPPSARSRG
jgi:hypothetical protein